MSSSKSSKLSKPGDWDGLRFVRKKKNKEAEDDETAARTTKAASIVYAAGGKPGSYSIKREKPSPSDTRRKSRAISRFLDLDDRQSRGGGSPGKSNSSSKKKADRPPMLEIDRRFLEELDDRTARRTAGSGSSNKWPDNLEFPDISRLNMLDDRTYRDQRSGCGGHPAGSASPMTTHYTYGSLNPSPVYPVQGGGGYVPYPASPAGYYAPSSTPVHPSLSQSIYYSQQPPTARSMAPQQPPPLEYYYSSSITSPQTSAYGQPSPPLSHRSSRHHTQMQSRPQPYCETVTDYPRDGSRRPSHNIPYPPQQYSHPSAVPAGLGISGRSNPFGYQVSFSDD